MGRIKTWLTSCLTFICVLVVNGCTTPTTVEEAPAPIAISVPLNVATVDESNALNVTVIAFEPGIDPEKKRVSQFQRHLRDAEAGYMPVVLKNTLEATRHWGAVRVLPEVDPAAEVLVTSQILQSNAVELKLQVRVSDSRGHVWLDRIYSDTTTDHGYDPDLLIDDDPFQDLYNAIANDMYEERARLDQAALSDILDISTLRYAVALSPRVFEHYLEVTDDGLIEMSSLPARDDAMYLRVRKIRESEYLFIDTMDEQFNSFYQKMQRAYPFWLQYSFDLMVYNEELKESGSTGYRRQNRWKTLEDVYKTYKEFKLNEDALRELAVSLDSEIRPTVAEYEGRVIELTGSLKSQYVEWRRILQEIYSAERE